MDPEVNPSDVTGPPVWRWQRLSLTPGAPAVPLPPRGPERLLAWRSRAGERGRARCRELPQTFLVGGWLRPSAVGGLVIRAVWWLWLCPRLCSPDPGRWCDWWGRKTQRRGANEPTVTYLENQKTIFPLIPPKYMKTIIYVSKWRQLNSKKINKLRPRKSKRMMDLQDWWILDKRKHATQ